MVSAAQPALPWHDRTVTAYGSEPAPAPAEKESGGFHPFGEDGFSFLDLIDVVNPLQHIPVIGPMYRELTGDTIDPLPRITGSTLYFGPIGASLAAADVVLEETTGKDTGEHVLAMLREHDATQTAEAGPVAAAGTDGEDPVSAWLKAEAAYRKQLLADRDAAAAPARSQAADAAPALEPQVAEAAVSEPPSTPRVSARAPMEAPENPVLAWAQAETAYRAALASRTPPAREAEPATAARNPVGEPSQPANQSAPQTASVPAGATASEGGWFSEVMLGALARYETSRDAATASHPHRRAVN